MRQLVESIVAIAVLTTTAAAQPAPSPAPGQTELVYHAPSAQLPARMHEAYGVPLQALETEWRRALE